MPLSRHLVLVGYRASGKTTVARLLSRRLKAPWVDSDALIEQTAGMPIPRIFAEQGEQGFRQWEQQAITTILDRSQPHVIATGGGCVVTSTVRQRLVRCSRDRSAMVCYLDVPVPVLQERLRIAAGNRPSLSGADVVDEVPGIVAQRDPWYREVADVCIPHESAPQAVVEAILLHLDRVEDDAG